MRHCLWRLRPCPLCRYKQLQRLWARGTQQQVRLVHVCTPCRFCRHTRLTYWKRWMSARPWAVMVSWSSVEQLIWLAMPPRRPPVLFGWSMAAMVAAERHLWFTLSDIKDKDRVFLLDVPFALLGLFCEPVNSIADRHQEARRHAVFTWCFSGSCLVALQLRRLLDGRSPNVSSSYREAQRQSVATCAPLSWDWGGKWRSAPGPSKPKTYLRAVLQAKKASKKPWRPRFSLRFPFLASAHRRSVCQPWCSREQRSPASIHLSFFARKHGAEMLTTPSGVSRAASSSVACRCAVLITPEASLERLVPLVDHLAAWKLLPNVSRCVLQTVERGYRIQFDSPLPQFNGVIPTLVGPKQAFVMEQEVDTLLTKEAIKVVPTHERESGFYSPYFIVPKKDGSCVWF